MKSFQPGKTHMLFCYLLKETTLNGELSRSLSDIKKLQYAAFPESILVIALTTS